MKFAKLGAHALAALTAVSIIMTPILAEADTISNIEKNQQNLNNPEEYFEGFFNDIIFKRQGNNNDLLNENNVQKNSSFGY